MGDSQLVQGRLKSPEIKRGNSFVGNDGSFFAQIRFQQDIGLPDKVVPDKDGIGVRRGLDGQSMHSHNKESYVIKRPSELKGVSFQTASVFEKR